MAATPVFTGNDPVNGVENSGSGFVNGLGTQTGNNPTAVVLESGTSVIGVTDPAHPFYVHVSEGPGVSLVSTPFDGTGYVNWSKAMLMCLSIKNKIGFIDGTYPRPDHTSSLYKAWERCNYMVSSWIMGAVTKEVGDSIIHSGTAKQMWDDLKNRFGQSNGAYIFQIKKELSGIKQGTSDIAAYYTRLKKCWDELGILESFMVCSCCVCQCNCGARTHNQGLVDYNKLMQFLMGLNESYTQPRGNILMMQPLPSVEKAYSLLIHEEKQREIHAGSQFISDSVSLNAGTNPQGYYHSSQKNTQGQNYSGYKSNYNTQNGRSYGNTSTNHPNSNSQNYQRNYQRNHQKSDLFCRYCKKNGHVIENCNKLKAIQGQGQNQNQHRNQGYQKGKRSAAAVQGSEATDSDLSEFNGVPGFTTEHLNQLMQLIQHVKVGNNQGSSVPEGVGSAHLAVKRPREQVADAEALLGLTNTVVESLDLCPQGGISPSIFISWLLKGYGLRRARSKNATQNLIIGKSQRAVNWEKIGADSSLLFMEGKGCKTMLGVLKTEFKARKTAVYDSYPNKITVYKKKSPRKVHCTWPKSVAGESAKDKPDVNKNMSTISELLKEKKSVMLDKLLFRRTSFAHTVENLFALSFLVHNGQAAISADETGSHFLCELVPRSNAHREVAYHHFILRYDYNDWKMMQDLVPEGEESMPAMASQAFSHEGLF